MKRLAAIASAVFAALAQPAAAQSTDFQLWLQSFRAEAAAAGIDSDVIDSALSNLSINTRVWELNDNQPEFTRSIWDYLDGAVSTTRVENGRLKLAEHNALLEQMEQKYGVHKETLIAIWGLETSYGRIMGDYDVIQALATLAFEGRRTGYGRSQLIGVLKIMQNGFASREELKGSWAGAMGHTQFIPTTYLSYAIDHDEDGRRDIWSNLGDVFASTANYLSVSKYNNAETWGLEVRLPENFEFSLVDKTIRKPVVEWSSLGVAAASGDPMLTRFDPNLRGRLILPAGAKGPAFLVFGNFEAILKYNRSTAYALAVSMLSDRAGGSDKGLVASWPRDDRALTLAERKSLQQALRDQGFDPGPIDGVIGAGTKSALRRWQTVNGWPADGYASSKVLEALKS